MRPKEYRYKLGNIISQLRCHLGWSQEKLAEMSQVDRSYISQIENGGNLTIDKLYKISYALGETPALILDKVERQSIYESRQKI